jgi:hypothetical protein
VDPSGRNAGLILLFHQSEWHLLMTSGFDALDNVYHYTTAHGFAGILEDNKLRATNFAF